MIDQPSPADAKARARWPIWRIVLAYAVLTALAAGSIWLVDRGAMQVGP